jgi:hypothetical protein
MAFIHNDPESIRLGERLSKLTDADDPWTLTLRAPSPLGAALFAEGVVPVECRSITITFAPDDVMMITYQVFALKTDIPKFHLALDAVGA